jgi:hypothetical protein
MRGDSMCRLQETVFPDLAKFVKTAPGDFLVGIVRTIQIEIGTAIEKERMP